MDCVQDEGWQGEHGVRFELDGLEGWTLVRRRRSQRKGKRLCDNEGESGGEELDISDGATYFK